MKTIGKQLQYIYNYNYLFSDSLYVLRKLLKLCYIHGALKKQDQIFIKEDILNDFRSNFVMEEIAGILSF